MKIREWMRSFWERTEKGPRLSPEDVLRIKTESRRSQQSSLTISQKKNKLSTRTWKNGRQGKRLLLETRVETCVQRKLRVQIG